MLQTVMNLLVVLGLVPTKGIGLPFISYGGSLGKLALKEVEQIIFIPRIKFVYSYKNLKNFNLSQNMPFAT